MSLPVRPPEPPSAPPPPPPLAVIPPSPDATIRDTPDRRYYALLEELVEEPLYDAAQLERGPATPRYFGTLPEPDREHPRSLLAPPMSPSTRRVTSSQSRRPSTRDAEVQVDADWDPRHRARRRIFEDRRHIGHMRPVPIRDVDDHHTPLDASLRVDLRRQRRLCDCERCVRHGTRLARSHYSADLPATVGLRFVTLPGITLTKSSTAEKATLEELLTQHPERTFVVCSCGPCTTHRNFLDAWWQARQYATTTQ